MAKIPASEFRDMVQKCSKDHNLLGKKLDALHARINAYKIMQKHLPAGLSDRITFYQRVACALSKPLKPKIKSNLIHKHSFSSMVRRNMPNTKVHKHVTMKHSKPRNKHYGFGYDGYGRTR